MDYLATLQDSIQDLLETSNLKEYLTYRNVLIGSSLGLVGVAAGSALVMYSLSSPDTGLLDLDSKEPSVEAIVRLKGGGEIGHMVVGRVRDMSDSITPSQVRVRVKCSRVNPADLKLMQGFPGITYKIPCIGGCDGSGIITKMGSNVDRKKWKIGDQVFFYKRFDDLGTWGTEVTMDSVCLAKIPSNVSLEYAGSIALNLQTAYETVAALDASEGETVLVLGAGGGVGFLAVTLAVARGLKVIAVASSRDETFLAQAGADRIIDYKNDDFVHVVRKENIKVDYVLDTVGEESLLKAIELKPKTAVTINVPNVDVLKDKLGVDLNWIVKKVLPLMSRKFENAADKAGVKLIAYCTGGNNAASLQKASDAIAALGDKFVKKPFGNKRTLLDVKENGLSGKDKGAILVFS